MATLSDMNNVLSQRQSSATPQATVPQLNSQKMGVATAALQQNGMGLSQAVNKAATNPSNQFAQGGDVPAPDPAPVLTANAAKYTNDPRAAQLAQVLANMDVIKKQENAPETPAAQPQTQQPKDSMGQMFNGYNSQQGQSYIKDRSAMQHYAKGGPVEDNLKNMPLKDMIRLLASHPEVANRAPMQGQDMNKGGPVSASGSGLLNMNRDVPTYADGGDVQDSDPNDNALPFIDGEDSQSVNMAVGGGLEGDTESDNITGYAPDGTPIIQNADGTQSLGDINSLLGRPESAPTAGTGVQGGTTSSLNTANDIAQQTPSMAKGGSEGPPPGSLSKEVADDVPAKLSEGEFVFSADVVRYYGLKTLNMLMDHARQELAEMNNDGAIRSPGDGKNPDQTGSGLIGQFMQDKTPDTNTYNNDQTNGDTDDAGDPVSGLLKECMGGGVDEELAKGGIVSSTSMSLAPKKLESNIASAPKMANLGQPKSLPGVKKFSLPKLKKGGLLEDMNC